MLDITSNKSIFLGESPFSIFSTNEPSPVFVVEPIQAKTQDYLNDSEIKVGEIFIQGGNE